MKQMDAYFKYWEDPNNVVIEAGQTDAVIEWLSNQSPETWHRVAMTWNYDYDDRVLSWILSQDRCDKGTAAQVFCVEGLGHWIGDETLETNPYNLCPMVLKNWTHYGSGEFRPRPKDDELLLRRTQEALAKGLYVGTPILEVVQYAGSRDAVSEFEAEDGKIVVAFEHWTKMNGIEITD